MKSHQVITIFCIFFFMQGIAQQQGAVEVKVPLWVSSRPNSGHKYTGIGFADKSRGGNYQLEAKKKRALRSFLRNKSEYFE